jgi:phosphomannomutase
MPERDGILAGIYFLDLMLKTGKTPSQLIDYLYGKVSPHYYQRRDFTFPEDKRQTIIKRVSDNLPPSIEGVKVAKINTTDGFHLTLADTTWLLIRFSGTEPVLRIYAESDSPDRVKRLLELGKELAGV